MRNLRNRWGTLLWQDQVHADDPRMHQTRIIKIRLQLITLLSMRPWIPGLRYKRQMHIQDSWMSLVQPPEIQLYADHMFPMRLSISIGWGGQKVHPHYGRVLNIQLSEIKAQQSILCCLRCWSVLVLKNRVKMHVFDKRMHKIRLI